MLDGSPCSFSLGWAHHSYGSSSIDIYKYPRIFIKIESIFIKITNPLSDLYKNHYTASWRPGDHLPDIYKDHVDFYKDQRMTRAPLRRI